MVQALMSEQESLRSISEDPGPESLRSMEIIEEIRDEEVLPHGESNQGQPQDNISSQSHSQAQSIPSSGKPATHMVVANFTHGLQK